MTRPPIFIPDVHGQRKALDALLKQLADADLLEGRQLVFLGDYLDAHTNLTVKDLVERMIELQQAGAVCLAGNHELVFRALLTPGEHLTHWYQRWYKNYVGKENTLASYGIDFAHLPNLRDSAYDHHSLFARLQELLANIPASHVAFLERLPLYWEQDQWIAVHAGVRPEQPLPPQAKNREELMAKIPVQSWAEQKAELDRMAADTTLLFAGQGPSQVCQTSLTLLNHETGLPWEDLHLPAGKCVVSGHKLPDPQALPGHCDAHISPARALLDLSAYYNHPLIAWVPDQEQIFSQAIV